MFIIFFFVLNVYNGAKVYAQQIERDLLLQRAIS